MTFRPFRLIALLLFCAIFLTGCESATDPVEDFFNPGDDTQNDTVDHVSWGSYRLYRYEAGNWRLIVDLGRELEPVPLLNERPVLIVHGLGASIDGGGFDPLADSLVSNGASAVFGFEYDTLEPVSTNSTYLNLALAYLTRTEKNRQWRIMAHSMGCLVSRSSLESGATFDMASQGNLVSFVAGPHLGTEIAEELVMGNLTIVQDALRQLVLRGQLNFRNADGRQVKVRGDEASFVDISLNSTFLNTLNFEAANKHPQFEYRTLAGTTRGSALEAFNRLLGVFADDGLVNVPSANAAVIGPVQTELTPNDHTGILLNSDALLLVIGQLGLLPATTP